MARFAFIDFSGSVATSALKAAALEFGFLSSDATAFPNETSIKEAVERLSGVGVLRKTPHYTETNVFTMGFAPDVRISKWNEINREDLKKWLEDVAKDPVHCLVVSGVFDGAYLYSGASFSLILKLGGTPSAPVLRAFIVDNERANISVEIKLDKLFPGLRLVVVLQSQVKPNGAQRRLTELLSDQDHLVLGWDTRLQLDDSAFRLNHEQRAGHGLSANPFHDFFRYLSHLTATPSEFLEKLSSDQHADVARAWGSAWVPFHPDRVGARRAPYDPTNLRKRKVWIHGTWNRGSQTYSKSSRLTERKRLKGTAFLTRQWRYWHNAVAVSYRAGASPETTTWGFSTNRVARPEDVSLLRLTLQGSTLGGRRPRPQWERAPAKSDSVKIRKKNPWPYPSNGRTYRAGPAIHVGDSTGVTPNFTLGKAVGHVPKGKGNLLGDREAVSKRLRELGFVRVPFLAQPTGEDAGELPVTDPPAVKLGDTLRLFQAMTQSRTVFWFKGATSNATRIPRQVDGRADPDKNTHRWLSASNAPAWKKMDLEGTGFENHEVRGGKPEAWASVWLQNVVTSAGYRYDRDYYKKLSVEMRKSTVKAIALNGASTVAGGPNTHSTHQSGLSTDVRIPRNGAAWGATTWFDVHPKGESSRYDQVTTRAQIDSFLNEGAVRTYRIFYNDPVLVAEGLCWSLNGHDNHLHVDIHAPHEAEE